MLKNKLIKKITVDELAVMVNNSFESQTKLITTGFETVNKNFETIGKNFETIGKNFESVNKNFEKVFNQLKIMDDKIDDLSSVKHRVDYIENILSIPIKK